ncbi:NhaP-type Na+/H+ or K+/H+ antiporter [Acetoanaerobium pronyense]|uniref:NhaP-type Na+/H+ or K+/H+ antiporter n=1 Tax=Acetoanaerobium pronyense TaxID=1482736 RepID=A0ABS4KHI9_9FIRM|nr:cation:proton antiporter [Acetoanaerobium pronyense]MBP2027253.1 NhaP-type Na+/H+ or K+/H+ antiporter [Acetoanaerobium pronyense]
MAVSLAIILILGLFMNKIFEKLKLPGLLGMLIVGVAMGPYGLDMISSEIMTISSDLRKIALIVILLRAGFGLNRDQLNKVGGAAIRMSSIPGIMEGFAVLFIAMYLFEIPFVEAGMLGFIIAAVSPAVIVPSMLDFIDRKKGEKNSVPTLILAGASVDDVFAITIFSSFAGLYMGNSSSVLRNILGIPVSIALGIIAGGIIGYILINLFKKHHMRDTKKVLIIIAIAILLNATEDLLLEINIPFASLLGVMAIGFVILEKDFARAKRLSLKFNKVWVFAEILLFVLVGAQVNINVMLDSGVLGLLIILGGLIFRSLGVMISLLGTKLEKKEKLFSVIAYIPKATVQAAMGAVPLSLGVPSGELILAISVLSIVVTAPLGAIGIKIAGEKLLD